MSTVGAEKIEGLLKFEGAEVCEVETVYGLIMLRERNGQLERKIRWYATGVVNDWEKCERFWAENLLNKYKGFYTFR